MVRKVGRVRGEAGGVRREGVWVIFCLPLFSENLLDRQEARKPYPPFQEDPFSPKDIPAWRLSKFVFLTHLKIHGQLREIAGILFSRCEQHLQQYYSVQKQLLIAFDLSMHRLLLLEKGP